MTTSQKRLTIFYQALLPLRIELRSTISNQLLTAKHEDCRFALTKAAISQIISEAHKSKMSYEEIMLDNFRVAFIREVREERFGGEEFRKLTQTHQGRVWVRVVLNGDITYTRVVPPKLSPMKYSAD